MAASFQEFLKGNLSNAFEGSTKGLFNKVAMVGYAAEIGKTDNKFKALLNTLKQFVLFNSKLFIPISFITAWLGLSKTVKSILHDTGSLDAALRRMASIQAFQRTFAPLLGGISAAKQRVAELIQISSKGPFRFEQMAGASRSLEVLTRGTFSGSEALNKIGNAAAASGNSIEDTAGAV